MNEGMEVQMAVYSNVPPGGVVQDTSRGVPPGWVRFNAGPNYNYDVSWVWDGQQYRDRSGTPVSAAALVQTYPGGYFEGVPGTPAAGWQYALTQGVWFIPAQVVPPGTYAGQTMPQGSTGWQPIQGGGVGRVALLALLADSPFYTAQAAFFATDAGNIASANSLGSFNKRAGNFAKDSVAFAMALSYRGTVLLDSMLLQGGGFGQNIDSSLAALQLGPAAGALVQASNTAYDAMATSASATTPATTATSAPWIPLIQAWSTFANQVGGFAAGFGTALSGTGALALLATGGGGLQGFGLQLLLDGSVLGPAITAFQAACSAATATAALGTNTTFADTQTNLAPWFAALGSFLAAMSSATVVRSITAQQ